jgi:ribosome-binding factor A
MKYTTRLERSMLKCCAEIHVDDGISPRHQKKEKQHLADHRLERICSQVQKAVRLAIAEYCPSTALSQWDVVSVKQEHNSPTLTVNLAQVEGEPDRIDVITSLLSQYRGVIRKTVAETITRKKTPSLRFQLIEGGMCE